MKKAGIVLSILLWISLCSVHIYSRTQPLEFEIHYDSHTKRTYEIKERMQETFNEIVSGIHADGQVLMMIHNIEKFSYGEVKASWNHKLILVEGDGKGSIIDGELTLTQYCMDKVQPRSFFQKLFGG